MLSYALNQLNPPKNEDVQFIYIKATRKMLLDSPPNFESRYDDEGR